MVLEAAHVPVPRYAGAGKHVHLNLGKGLNAVGGGYETGWVASWTSSLATTASGWDMKLSGGTWSPAPGSIENRPITNVTWFDAYAFCIWDGGFLPSEAEWNYAAAGGNEQRVYPWSLKYPPGSNDVSCANAWYSGCANANTPAGQPIAVGGLSPGVTGNGARRIWRAMCSRGFSMRKARTSIRATIA